MTTLCLVALTREGPDALAEVMIAGLRAVADVIHVQAVETPPPAAYATLLAGRDLSDVDTLILADDNLVGPVHPLPPMFAAMTARPVWTAFAHVAGRHDTLDPTKPVPPFPRCDLLVIRPGTAAGRAALRALADLPAAVSAREGAFRLRGAFAGPKIDASVFAGPDRYASADPAIYEPARLVRDGCPLLLRSAFLADPQDLEIRGIDLGEVLPALRATGFDTAPLLRSLLREAPLRTLVTNLGLVSVLPDRGERAVPGPRIAILAHVYHADMIDDILVRAAHVPPPCDLIMTTDTEEKAETIGARARERHGAGAVCVHRTRNRGRDMPALFITLRDTVLGGGYDLCCRIHSKRSSEAGPQRGELLTRAAFDSVLGGPAHVAEILRLFAAEPGLGLVMPPLPHIGLPTLGHAWFTNRPMTEQVLRMLDISVPLDDATPLAPYGGMYWFRPTALRRLFAHPWRWEDFPEEPAYGDGDLPHALERAIAPVAQQAGYHPRIVLDPALAAKYYVRLEWKAQRLASRIPSDLFAVQMHWLTRIDTGRPGIRGAIARVARDFAASVRFRIARPFRTAPPPDPGWWHVP